MRLPSWLRVTRTHSQVGTVTVTLVADTSRFEAAMSDVASISRYRGALARQRALGRAYVAERLDELALSAGLDPVDAWRLPRARDQRVAGLTDPDPARRRAAELAWLRDAREHQAEQHAARLAEVPDA